MPGRPTTLRAARPGDARAVAEIHVRAWKAAYPGLLPQDYLDALRPEDRLGQWEEALGPERWPAVVVAEADGLLQGFCAVGPTRDEDLDPAGHGELFTIYVDPPCWARGVGRTLMAWAVAELAGAGFVSATLWVLDVNAAARGFYEHLGWHADGAAKRHDWGAFVATDVRYRRALSHP